MMTGSKAVFLGFLILLILGLGTALWMRRRLPEPAAPIIACPQDARVCPDGTFVSRIPPSCQFRDCPIPVLPSSTTVMPSTTTLPAVTSSLPLIPASWKMIRDQKQGVSYAFPETLSTQYVTTQDWPPTLTVERGIFSCVTAPRVVQDRAYCVSEQNEGAAGSMYTHYVYTTADVVSQRLFTLRFTLRRVQCFNYDEPRQSACMQEQGAFQTDTLADQVLSSVRALR